MKKIIERKEYLDFLIRFKDHQLIKVVSGIRRSGKSTLLELFKNYLVNNGISKKQIISVNFEELDFEELQDYKKLYEYLKNQIIKDKMNYIFLDEIHHCLQFEKVVDSLFIKENIDIYITGSNAYFMSGDLATLLSGRYVELKILPLSFKEYCDATPEKSLSSKYNDYLLKSSFPYTLRLTEQEDINIYLNGLYNTVLIKDIMQRYKISDVVMLESVIKFIYNNIGNKTTVNSISKTMTSNGRKIDQKTVEKYLKAFIDSLMVYEAKRYNVKGKEILKLQEKYYVVDIGIRYMLLGGRNIDTGHILENIIFLELIRRGFEVYVGQLDSQEIDFIAIKEDDIFYYQVSETVRDPNTLKRELDPLMKINDHYQKIILTLDEDPKADYNGIKRINALEWLLDK